jgi:NAD(P)-dependent dehydrogenase (short-subunit alcohol dehydrogenase family)
MAGSLDGKVAFVTGGGSGIGAATARILAREGARVAVTDINDEGGRQVVAEILEAGGDARYMHLDVTSEDEVGAAIQETVDHFGHLDCAVNSAGINDLEVPPVDYSKENWDRIIAINLTGVWLCIQAEVRQMLTSGGGSIVNVSSGAGLRGRPHKAPYAASKHGIIGITTSVAMAYGSDGIRVNAICPGLIDTPMSEPTLGDPVLAEQAIREQIMGRYGEAMEVGEVIAWLCGDAASFVTGVALPVDGGALA